MNDILGYDSPLGQVIIKITEFICLMMMWCICSVPIITMGASTTAFYYSFNKSIRRDEGHFWKSFWHSFKLNFKQATLLGVIQAVVIAVLLCNCYAVLIFRGSYVPEIMAWILIAISVVVLMWTIYWLPYISKFDNSVKNVLKNSIILLIRNLHWTLLLIVFLVVAAVLIASTTVGIFIVPAIYLALNSIVFEKIFEKYISPEEVVEAM